jgi:hypothetical protein
VDIHKRWAIQRMALRAALEAAIENELRQANPQTDEMINGLLAGENVEPFQFSKEVQEMAEGCDISSISIGCCSKSSHPEGSRSMSDVAKNSTELEHHVHHVRHSRVRDADGHVHGLRKGTATSPAHGH